MMCLIAFDWKVGDNLRISIEKIDGAEPNYQRIRVVGTNITTGYSSLLATIDKGASVDLASTFFMFNENFGRDAFSCHQVPTASVSVTKVSLYLKDGRLGNLTSGKSDSPPAGHVGGTNCLNYGAEVSSNGIEMFSGGTDRWVEIKPAFDNLGGKFQDEWMATILPRTINVTVLNPKK